MRKLLAASSVSLPWSFSPDGEIMAYANKNNELCATFFDDRPDIQLGQGTSPSWSKDSKTLFFRRPGVRSFRDQVMASSRDNWKAKVILDFPGEPVYPKNLSATPPAVDTRFSKDRLFTMFYRVVRKDGSRAVHRWLVEFSAQGKILGKKGEQLTE